MLCPACQQPVHETAATCGACGFSLQDGDTAFGAPPLVERPVTDPNDHLGRAGRSNVLQEVADFHQRFPQCDVTLLLLSKPPQAAARPWLFWLFNRGGLHSVMEKGGACRRVLLWIDPDTRRLAAICGYGLEPLLPAQHLRDCLQAASDHASTGQFARAAQAFLRELSLRLTRLHFDLPRTYGWSDPQLWCSLDADADPADSVAIGAAPSDGFAY